MTLQLLHSETLYIRKIWFSFLSVHPSLWCCTRNILFFTYVEYRAVSGVFQNIDPPPPLHPASVSSPRTKGGGINTRPAVRGWGVNILKYARHWIGLLQYNLSTLYTLELCSFATMTSCIDPSVRIVTKSPKVEPLLIFSISLTHRCCYITVHSATTGLQNDVCIYRCISKQMHYKTPFSPNGYMKSLEFYENYITLFCLEKNKLFDSIILTQNHAWHMTKVVEKTI